MICKSCYKATVDTFVVIVYSGKEVYKATSKIKALDYYNANKSLFLDFDFIIIEVIDECPRCKKRTTKQREPHSTN